MTPDEYAEALEVERKARNDRARYIVRDEGNGRYALLRRNGARQAWGVTAYTSRETAQLAADVLNRLKADEA
ncbi:MULTISPECIES: hypothetical protein [unclassified Streptomyces]|uniref:hypothetical protein n=1 Tax=unclassified Streptomyces TaxID=2593676 RepID=UPI0035D83CD5